jgi:ABC-2 type transport system ATP-binding protein
MIPPADDGYAIDLQNVTKIYRRRVHALRGVSMQVRRGEIFGLLGPNGAGKSTLVKIMVTVVRPTTAQGMILGRPIGHKPTLGRVGYLPENHRFPRYLSGRQVIEFFSALAKSQRSSRRRRAAELLELVGMTPWADEKISQYSKGMLQRVGLAQTMGADPDLIILDEPTDGVDPAGRRDIRQALTQLREKGTTIFINSHLLSELESVCDRVAILVAGKVARQGSVDELTIARQCYVLELESPVWEQFAGAFPGTFDGAPAPGRPARGTLPDGTWCEFDGVALRIGKTDPVEVQPTIDALRKGNLVIRRIQLVRPSLEDLFFETVTA